MSDKEQIEAFCDDFVNAADEVQIVNDWCCAVSELDISTEFITMYRLKFDCPDWRATAMKNDYWKIKMKKMMKKKNDSY